MSAPIRWHPLVLRSRLQISLRVPFMVQSQIEIVPIDRLSDEMRADWDLIRASSAAFRSPFFSHGFCEKVGKVLPEIYVAVVSQEGEAVAFFPFQRRAGKHARPVGAGINDVHGILAKPSFEVPVAELLRETGLRSYAFEASPVESPIAAQFELGRVKSFYADLTVDPKGYEHFLRQRNSTIDRQGQKTRRLIKDFGPMRFEYDCRDPEMLERLIQLKREQYQRTHVFDVFSMEWIRGLMFDFFGDASSSPRGLLNVLYVDEVPVALHFGMLEREVLHYWFPVFDPAYAIGSPGTELFLRVARQAADLGVKMIDMGTGEQAYKAKLTNGVAELSYGLLDSSPARRTAHGVKRAIQCGFRNSKFHTLLKPYARKVLPRLGQIRFGG